MVALGSAAPLQSYRDQSGHQLLWSTRMVLEQTAPLTVDRVTGDMTKVCCATAGRDGATELMMVTVAGVDSAEELVLAMLPFWASQENVLPFERDRAGERGSGSRPSTPS